MVSINTAIFFSPEFEKLKEELKAQRAAYSELLEEYESLTKHTLPHLSREYLNAVGHKEYRLYSLEVEIQRCRRMITLYQQALNRKAKITPAEVETVIQREFEEYNKQLEQRLRDLKEAEDSLKGHRLNDEEQKILRQCYLRLARKLHPDLNPELPPGAEEYWHRVTLAYQGADWQWIQLLEDEVDEFLGRNGHRPPEESSSSSLERLNKEKSKLAQKRALLEERMDKIKSKPPYTYLEFLSKPTEVRARRKELDQQILQHEEHLRTLQAHLKELEGAMNDV